MRRLGPAAALILVAANLRIAIAALPAVLDQAQRSTGLSGTGTGLLTALPLFCFGALAFVAPGLIRRYRMAPLLAFAMIVVAAGCAVRLAPSVVALFVGTAVLGAGIAIGNVLLPGLIKRDFHERVTTMTAGYSVSLFVGAALSAGLTVPLEHAAGIGWRSAMAVWGLVALIAAALWLPHARCSESGQPTAATASPVRGLWRDRLAWSVTLFMGLQSLGYYATLNWVPSILEAHEVTQTTADWMLSFSMFPGMAAALCTPALERRVGRPATMVVLAAALNALAYLGLLISPAGGAYAWMTLLGLGQGVAISLALGYIVARAPDGHHAAHLSTMAQGVGYLIACTGPFLVGALHDLTSGWTVSLIVLLGVLVPLTIAGLRACRDGTILAGAASAPTETGDAITGTAQAVPAGR